MIQKWHHLPVRLIKAAGVRVDSLKAGELKDAMMACWESRESLAERVGEAASGMRELALQSGADC